MRAFLATVLSFFLQSRMRLWLAVLGITTLFGLFEFGVSRWFIGVKAPPNIHAASQALIVGLGAGIALWLVFLGLMDRRRLVEDELRRVAALNHIVRNSLEVIVLAHYSEADCEHKMMVLECTNRIDRTLKELFPDIGIGAYQRNTDLREKPHNSKK